jgi:hypothetical protein
VGNFNLLLIFVGYAFIHSFVKNINLGGGKFSCTNPTLKEKVQFGKGSSGGLRNTEVGVDDTEEANSSLGNVRFHCDKRRTRDSLPRRSLCSYPSSKLQDLTCRE